MVGGVRVPGVPGVRVPVQMVVPGMSGMPAVQMGCWVVGVRMVVMVWVACSICSAMLLLLLLFE